MRIIAEQTLSPEDSQSELHEKVNIELVVDWGGLMKAKKDDNVTSYSYSTVSVSASFLRPWPTPQPAAATTLIAFNARTWLCPLPQNGEEGRTAV